MNNFNEAYVDRGYRAATLQYIAARLETLRDSERWPTLDFDALIAVVSDELDAIRGSIKELEHG